MSIRDIANMINSGDSHSLLKVLFSEEGEDGRRAADVIERVLRVTERGGAPDEVKALLLEESDVSSQDVMRLVVSSLRAFGGRFKAMDEAFKCVEGGGECVICCETFENGRKCVVCGNVFHRGCLVVAVDVAGKCPMCRAEVDFWESEDFEKSEGFLGIGGIFGKSEGTARGVCW